MLPTMVTLSMQRMERTLAKRIPNLPEVEQEIAPQPMVAEVSTPEDMVEPSFDRATTLAQS